MECPIMNKECPRKKWEDVCMQNFFLGHSLFDIRHSIFNILCVLCGSYSAAIPRCYDFAVHLG